MEVHIQNNKRSIVSELQPLGSSNTNITGESAIDSMRASGTSDGVTMTPDRCRYAPDTTIRVLGQQRGAHHHLRNLQQPQKTCGCASVGYDDNNQENQNDVECSNVEQSETAKGAHGSHVSQVTHVTQEIQVQMPHMAQVQVAPVTQVT